MLRPQIEASSEFLRPPGECIDSGRAELHFGVWHNFLHTVIRTVTRMTNRQREIPATTTTFPPRKEYTVGGDGTVMGGRMSNRQDNRIDLDFQK